MSLESVTIVACSGTGDRTFMYLRLRSNSEWVVVFSFEPRATAAGGELHFRHASSYGVSRLRTYHFLSVIFVQTETRRCHGESFAEPKLEKA